MDMINKMKQMSIKKVYDYLDKDPDKNIPKLMDWVDRFASKDLFASQRKVFREVIENPDNNWYQLMKSLWTDIDKDVRKKLFENFILNASLIGWQRQDECREKYNCNIPWAILMDPTSACNLQCIGCWAAEYGDKLSMDYEMLDNIINQGKELGVYFYIYSGGEPLVRKKDIISLCEKHTDCVFLSFTNGTLIDEAFADEM
ncbi:MAG: radical SAM protein, partial [Epulopiscium sp.]|nr:radical SAM protein [Candidatus Epulonipiscium sp.]